jgi:hypothetical protein
VEARDAERVVKVVLALLHERGMDVVFVGHYMDGERRFRVVEALRHGRAAALATGREDASASAGVLLETPVVFRDGRVHGKLCCFCPGQDAAATERDLRTLRYGARLAARLLDNEQVLRELVQQASH